MINYYMKAYKFFSSEDRLNKFVDNYNKNYNFLDKQLKHDYKDKRVLAIYDFADSPYTSDISFFILNAEIERRRFNLEKVDIIFLSNDKYPCNPNYQVINNHKQLIYNFAIEFTRLFSFIGSVSVLDNRILANDIINSIKTKYRLFPQDYDTKFPFERLIDLKRSTYYVTNYAQYANIDSSLNCITPPMDQIRLAKKLLKKFAYPKIPITITLRETQEVQKARNSNILAWQKLVDNYKDKPFIFIILRDYYTTFDKDEPIKGENVVYCENVSLSLSFRSALYNLASLNLGIANGVLMPLILSQKSQYIIFKWITDNSECVTINHYKEYYGFNKDSQWYNATKYQKFVWEDDDFEVLKRETDAMLKLLEDDGKLYPECYKDDFKYEIEKIEYDQEIYKQPSLISQRTPLKYYVYMFNIIKLFRKFFNFNEMKHLEDIRIKETTKILIYAAGTITKSLVPKYKNNIVGIVDKNYAKISSNEFSGIELYSVEDILKFDFDYIVITPKLREYTIQKELINLYNIPKNKFLIATNYK